MLWTDVVLIIMLLAGFFVYFSAKRQLRQGSLQGWLKWTEPFIQVNKQQSAWQRKPQGTTGNLSAEALASLDNLYREFMEEVASIREEMVVQAEDLRSEFAARLNALEAISSQIQSAAAGEQIGPSTVAHAVESVLPVIPEVAEEEDTEQQRFEILDLLVQGFAADVIARKLQIGVAEVQLVEQLMKHPNH